MYAPGARVDHLIPAARSTPEWLIRRVAWQAVSDAISKPDRARQQARRLAREGTTRKRFDHAVNLFRFWRRYRRGLRDADYYLVYDLVTELLCVGL